MLNKEQTSNLIDCLTCIIIISISLYGFFNLEDVIDYAGGFASFAVVLIGAGIFLGAVFLYISIQDINDSRDE